MYHFLKSFIKIPTYCFRICSSNCWNLAALKKKIKLETPADKNKLKKVQDKEFYCSFVIFLAYSSFINFLLLKVMHMVSKVWQCIKDLQHTVAFTSIPFRLIKTGDINTVFHLANRGKNQPYKNWMRHYTHTFWLV